MNYDDIKAEILAFLKDRYTKTPIKSMKIAKETKLKPQHVQRALTELRNEGAIRYDRSTNGWEVNTP